MMVDYLVVGSGLFGCVFAHEMAAKGKSCLVLEKRAHVGGNVYGEEKDGILIHRYGAHIFHTSYEDVWAYVNQFVSFNGYINSPVANYRGHLYNLPFNMNTFRELWDIVTPREAREIIARQRAAVHPDELLVRVERIGEAERLRTLRQLEPARRAQVGVAPRGTVGAQRLDFVDEVARVVRRGGGFRQRRGERADELVRAEQFAGGRGGGGGAIRRGGVRGEDEEGEEGEFLHCAFPFVADFADLA